MSADGNLIAFTTRAGNLSAADSDGPLHTDVFLRNVSAATTELVSVTLDGGRAGRLQGAGFYTTISPDGRYVAFDSDSPNLTADDAAGGSDVFVRDRTDGTTLFVSRVTGAAGAPGDYHSWLPQISADGTKVAFMTQADNLGSISTPDPETPLHRLNVYVRDLAAGTTVLASRANGAGGAPGNADSGGQPGLAISDDGTKVVFHSQATNLGSATRGSVAIQSYLRNLSTSPSPSPVAGGASSPAVAGHQRRRDARGVLHRLGAGVRRHRRPARRLRAPVRARHRRRRRRRRPRRRTPTATPRRLAARRRARRRRARSRCAATRRSRAAPPTTSTSPAPRSTSTSSTCCRPGRRVAVTGAADLRLAGQTRGDPARRQARRHGGDRRLTARSRRG